MKRFLTVLLSLLLVFTAVFLPDAEKAKAEGTITNVAITYDVGRFKASTKFTVGELTQALRTVTDWQVDEMSYVDLGSTYLVKKDPGEEWSVEVYYPDDSRLDTGGDYYLCFNIEENRSYFFDTDHLPNVTINGAAADYVEWGYQSATGHVNAFIKVDLCNEDAVFKVDVSPKAQKVMKNTSFRFSTEVFGSVKTVNWSLSGNSDLTTKVDREGLVQIGPDETSETLTVRATSKLNPNVYDEAQITVTDYPVYISSVSIGEDVVYVKRGDSYTFSNVTVNGTEDPDLVWTLTGSIDNKSYISSYGEHNLRASVSVNIIESADELTVRAASKKYRRSTMRSK